MNVLWILVVLAGGGGPVDETDEKARMLFDGKSLSGWEKHGGGASYKVEEGCIVGEVGPGSNTFLCTEKTFGDFKLVLDVKLDVPGNSGIQFRSHLRKDKDRVFGYQCEIDPSDRAWSGGVYDEGRRGWLAPLEGKEDARKAFRKDGWNEYVIETRGPWIQTWLNGVQCVDLVDTADLEGFIALQVHSGKAGRLRWKNVRLYDRGQTSWQPLWNGTDLSGFNVRGGGEWKIEDGAIHGTCAKDEKRHGHLVSERRFGDFALRVKYKSVKGNSGLYFRIDEGGGVGVKGFQAEIDPNKDAGGLYETGGRAWVVKPKPEDVKKWYKPGEWNEMTVVAFGGRVVVHVNGKKSAELFDDPGRAEGHVALQLHGGQAMDIWFSSLEWMDLSGILSNR